MDGDQIVVLLILFALMFVAGYATAYIVGCLHCERSHHVENEQPDPRQ